MTQIVKRKTIAEISEDTLKLQSYFQTKPAGSVLSYGEIEQGSGVKMDTVGKSRLRSALNGLRVEYSVVPGQGIRLADHLSATQIVGQRFRKIDRAVHRADKTHRRLQQQFLDEMTSEEKHTMLFAGAVFGAIRLAAEQGRRIQKALPKESSSTVQIPIPCFAKTDHTGRA